MSAPCALVSSEDTIVAQSTAAGAAAIAIVRLSGPHALQIAETLAQAPLPTPHKLSRQQLFAADGSLLDDAMLVQMPKPHSYTGDDLVELHLHGGPAVSQAVQAACRALGARNAEAGEFTRRAYANGKMTLTSLEAVAALVHAETEQERRASVSLLAGGLEERVRPWLEELMQVVALARAAMDFPEDVDQSAFPAASRTALAQVKERLESLVQAGSPLDAGVPHWVLRGPSNAGKSTLLNALVGYERALTDAAPGTTRDTLSAELPGLGGRVVLWDTAGLHAQAEGVEARGIAMATALSRRASVVLWLLGAEVVWPPVALVHDDQTLWVVGSHADAFGPEARDAIEREARARKLSFLGWVSVPTNEGVDRLQRQMQAWRAEDDGAARVALTRRHREQLLQAVAALGQAMQALARNGAEDVALLDVEAAMAALDALFGEGVEPQVFEQIFARFCIGK